MNASRVTRLSVRHGIVWLLAASPVAAGFGEGFSDRYWPAFPAPSRIVLSESHNRLEFGEHLLLQTLSGLVAHRARTRGAKELIWIGIDSPSYDEWRRRFLEYSGACCDPRIYTVWELVDRYRDTGLVKGYILCRKDPADRALYEGVPADWSVNAATALCPLLSGVAVEEELEERARASGLRMLVDVRDKDEAWLWGNYGRRFSRRVLARQDPKSAVMCQEVVAFQAGLSSRCDALYDRALGAMRPGSPVLGWGFGLENEQTGPSSRYGLLQTATNWCINLPLLSSGKTGLRYPFRPFALPATTGPEDSGARYVSFVLSDGDNVQWLMLNFCRGDEAYQYWGSPDRGRMPFGWTIPAMDLLQLCPYALDYLRDTATPNDDFVLAGGGYYYPDEFGAARPKADALVLHARRLAKYMQRCGLTLLMVNCQEWDSPGALDAYAVYAREIPFLEGILVVQYAPYTAGGGAVRWVTRRDGCRIPVITARHAIWSNRHGVEREGSPGRVADDLGRWASEPCRSSEDRFAWTVVHAWSWFRHVAPAVDAAEEEVPQQSYARSDDIARGYRPALWCSERLPSNVHVVTPRELVARLREAGNGG
mgnify:FL=1